jgi:hypothetical protein
VADTVATATLLDVQVTSRSVTTVPEASFTVVVNVVEAPTRMVAESGCSVTLATAGGTTVTVLVPDCPSLVTEMVAEPGVTAVTRPVGDTVATAGLLELQLTTRSVSTAPLASFTVGRSDTLLPTTSDALLGVTVTLATGAGLTLMVAVPDFPSLCAVIVAEPGERAETTPAADTLATAELSDDQVTARSSGAPLASLISTPRVTVPPTVSAALDGCTTTLATGTGDTVTDAFPLAPSLVAVMVAVPTPFVVTSPDCETVATPASLELQLMTRPESGEPFTSRGVAVNVACSPSTSVRERGCTSTLATGGGCTLSVAMADMPPALAAIWVLPTLRAVTTPVGEMRAIAVSFTDHTSGTLVSASPDWSRTVA